MIKTIVITGASSGIGSALANLYAAPDIKLGLIGRNQERLNETAMKCRASGAKTEIATIDVTDQENLVKWILDFDDKHPIDLVIASAGILELKGRNAATESPENIRYIMETNYIGAVSTIDPVIERMRQRSSGQIAMLSSLSAYRGLPQFPAYAASKAALKIYYECLRGQLVEEGIVISIVCPGFVKTSMTNELQKYSHMMMPVDEAARIIKKGLDNKQALISFPKSQLLGLWFLGLLPNKLADRIILRMFG